MPVAASGKRQQNTVQSSAISDSTLQALGMPRRRTAYFREKLHPAHKALLWGLCLALAGMLLFSVSLVLQQRLNSLQSQQQIQSWKDYAQALKSPAQPESGCSLDCAPSASSSALRVDEEESSSAHESGQRFHF